MAAASSAAAAVPAMEEAAVLETHSEPAAAAVPAKEAAAVFEAASEPAAAAVPDDFASVDSESDDAATEPPMGVGSDAERKTIKITVWTENGINYKKGKDGKKVRCDEKGDITRARGDQGKGSKRRASERWYAKQAARQQWQSSPWWSHHRPLQGHPPPVGEGPHFASGPSWQWQGWEPNAPATGGASSSSSHQGAPTPNAPATGGDSSSPALPATGGTPADPQPVSVARLKARAALGKPEVAQRFADALGHNRDGQ